VTSVDRTAYPGFARVVSARELAEAFTPTEAELEWARGRTQDENHLLALVVWLKSYQRLGYFPKVEDVPTVVVGHVRDALELGDDVELERAAVRSAKRHREFVRRRLVWSTTRPGCGRSPRRRSARRRSPRTTTRPI
jgi:hypothetical protein